MKQLLIFTLGIILVTILGVRMMLGISAQHHFTEGERLRIRTTLRQEPKISYGKQQFSVNSRGFEPLYVTTTLFPEYHYADTININGTVRRKVLDKGREIATLNQPQIAYIETRKTWYQSLKSNISSLYERTLPTVGASLMMGIVFGSKENLPSELDDALQREGLTHIVAASGMNVSLISSIILVVSLKLFRRRLALGAAILGIVGYCLLTGFEPSIVRASLMSVLGYSAVMTGRQKWGLGSLLVAGYLMLFYDPPLIFDLGFQLSFLATSGIMYIKPFCEKLIFTEKKRSLLPTLLKEDLTTTLSAQLSTTPLLLMTFGQVNLASVISNVLLLWTIPFLMVIGIAAACIGVIIPSIGQLILFLSLPLLWYFETIVSLTYPLFFPVSIDHGLPVVVVCAYYLLLLSLILYKPYEKTTSYQ